MSLDANPAQRTITDPVVMFDSMWEAANSLRGSLIWLKRHAPTSEEAQAWWSEYLQVRVERDAVKQDDMEGQYAAMITFRRREAELEPLLGV